MKKFLKWSAWGLGVLLLLALIGIFVGSMFIDKGITTVLSKIDGKVAGLSLENDFTDSSFNGQSGVLYWNYALPSGNPLGVNSLAGAVSYEVTVGLFCVNVDFKKVDGYGNLDRVSQDLGLVPINYSGSATVSVWDLTAEGKLKTDSFEIPLADGKCKVEENTVSFGVNASKNIRTGLKVSGFDCIGRDLYSGRPSYDVRLEDLSVAATPKFEGKSVSVNEVSISLKKFDGNLSSIYLIGFGPDENVRDRSLRESVKVEDMKVKFGFSDKDYSGNRMLRFDGYGNIFFAFPYVKENQIQPYYDLKDLRLTTDLGYVNLEKLHKALKTKSEELPAKVMAAFSDTVAVKLKNFSLTHGGEEIKVSGEASVNLDKKNLKPLNTAVMLNVQAGRNFVESLAQDQYREALQTLLKNGSVRTSGSSYSTHFELRNNAITLNGIPMAGQD
ncbi:MAG: DUF945 family protein [Succinivibrio sp.]|nr:DUF945 family protein [Succinivibrio sp.]